MRKQNINVEVHGKEVHVLFVDKGKVLKMDKKDYEKFEGRISIYQYWKGKMYGNVGGKFLHRLILEVDDRKLMVDHINGDSLDNRRSNLRICSNAQNQWNTDKKVNSNQEVKGVRKTRYNTYEARIRVNGKRLHLGTFKTLEEARNVYNQKAKELHEEFAFINK